MSEWGEEIDCPDVRGTESASSLPLIFFSVNLDIFDSGTVSKVVFQKCQEMVTSLSCCCKNSGMPLPRRQVIVTSLTCCCRNSGMPLPRTPIVEFLQRVGKYGWG